MIPKFDRERYYLMVDEINKLKPIDKDICDIGCGMHPISDMIVSKKTTTIDSDARNGPDLVWNITKGLPFKRDSYDIVIMGEIIEHVFDSKTIMQEAKRILVPNGHLVLSTPNICSLRYRIAFLFGKIPAHASKGAINGHVRDFNLTDIKELMESTGFTTTNVQGDGIWMNGFRLPAPTTLSDCLILTARKKP